MQISPLSRFSSTNFLSVLHTVGLLFLLNSSLIAGLHCLLGCIVVCSSSPIYRRWNCRLAYRGCYGCLTPRPPPFPACCVLRGAGCCKPLGRDGCPPCPRTHPRQDVCPPPSIRCQANRRRAHRDCYSRPNPRRLHPEQYLLDIAPLALGSGPLSPHSSTPGGSCAARGPQTAGPRHRPAHRGIVVCSALDFRRGGRGLLFGRPSSTYR